MFWLLYQVERALSTHQIRDRVDPLLAKRRIPDTCHDLNPNHPTLLILLRVILIFTMMLEALNIVLLSPRSPCYFYSTNMYRCSCSYACVYNEGVLCAMEITVLNKFTRSVYTDLLSKCNKCMTIH
jgi:hypothetical protein